MKNMYIYDNICWSLLRIRTASDKRYRESIIVQCLLYLYVWQWHIIQPQLAQNQLLCFHCKMVTQMHHNFTLHVHYLSCWSFGSYDCWVCWLWCCLTAYKNRLSVNTELTSSFYKICGISWLALELLASEKWNYIV